MACSQWWLALALPCLAYPAEVVRLDAVTWNLAPEAKQAGAVLGDYVIRNDKVVAIIGDAVLNRKGNVQGAVIGFTFLGASAPPSGVFYPHGPSEERPAAVEAQLACTNAEIAKLKFRSPATAADPVERFTEYQLRDGEAFLRVETRTRQAGREDNVVSRNLAPGDVRR